MQKIGNLGRKFPDIDEEKSGHFLEIKDLKKKLEIVLLFCEKQVQVNARFTTFLPETP